MLIKVNGEKEEIEPDINLSEYLENKGVDFNQVVVQYNGQIIDKNSLNDIDLQPDDNLEILKFVGGG